MGDVGRTRGRAVFSEDAGVLILMTKVIGVNTVISTIHEYKSIYLPHNILM